MFNLIFTLILLVLSLILNLSKIITMGEHFIITLLILILQSLNIKETTK